MLSYHFPLDHGEFDVVLFLETVEHVSQPERLVAELWRVFKPGGVLVLSTPNVLWEPIQALAAVTGLHHSEGPHRFIRYNKLLAVVEEAGFQVERAETNVLGPEGPGWLVRLSEWLEEGIMQPIMPVVRFGHFLTYRRLS